MASFCIPSQPVAHSPRTSPGNARSRSSPSSLPPNESVL